MGFRFVMQYIHCILRFLSQTVDWFKIFLPIRSQFLDLIMIKRAVNWENDI